MDWEAGGRWEMRSGLPSPADAAEDEEDGDDEDEGAPAVHCGGGLGGSALVRRMRLGGRA